MTRFAREWLRLREPLDAASRARAIAATLKGVMPERPIQIIDLATGTGANLRYLSQILGGRQEWCLIDRDRMLLDAIPVMMSDWIVECGGEVRQSGPELILSSHGFECRVRSELKDLASDLATVDFPPGALVSASALLDLASEAWLGDLAQRCLAVRAPVLFALNYDGTMAFDPHEPEDERVRELVNRHQMTDKGLGQALGPAAGPSAEQIFQQLGYRVESAPSAWRLRPREQSVQMALLEMWLAAALEIAPDEASPLRDWAERRREHVVCGRSAMNVGHVDILGWLPG